MSSRQCMIIWITSENWSRLIWIGNLPGFRRIQRGMPNEGCYFDSFAISCQISSDSQDNRWLSKHIIVVVAYEVIVCGSILGCILYLHKFLDVWLFEALVKNICIIHVDWPPCSIHLDCFVSLTFSVFLSGFLLLSCFFFMSFFLVLFIFLSIPCFLLFFCLPCLFFFFLLFL